MRFYSEAEMEGTMKVQEAILRAMVQQIIVWQVATMLESAPDITGGGSCGTDSIGSHGCMIGDGRPSPPRAAAEKILSLKRKPGFDFNVRHCNEKLTEEQGIELNYSWLQAALEGG